MSNLNTLKIRLLDFLKMELDILDVADAYADQLDWKVRRRRSITGSDLTITRNLRSLVRSYTSTIRKNK